jgi:hypothetical protein
VSHFKKNIVVTALVAATWVSAVAFGAHVLLKYETTPGSVGTTSSRWPSGSVLTRPVDKRMLVMFAHPHCPCTRASIAELAEVMAHAVDRATVFVLFVKPAGAGIDWDDTDLRRTAAAIPGVTVLTDENGLEAARFGAETSGHTVVFETNGDLLFSGGITGSRGHVGSNAGEGAVLAALRQEKMTSAQAPVYGCRIAKHGSVTGKEPCSR